MVFIIINNCLSMLLGGKLKFSILVIKDWFIYIVKELFSFII